jgi:hypothetical protein
LVVKRWWCPGRRRRSPSVPRSPNAGPERVRICSRARRFRRRASRRGWRLSFAYGAIKDLEEHLAVIRARLSKEVRRSQPCGNLWQIAPARDKQDRNPLLACVMQQHLVSHFRPTQIGHLDIEQDAIRKRFGIESLQSLFAAMSDPDPVPGRFQKLSGRLCDVVVVVDNENRGHLGLSPSARCPHERLRGRRQSR